MKKVCVITGGGSGMGLAAAKEMGKDYYIIISGRTVSKLENAINELKAMGIEAEACACDVSKRETVIAMAERAKEIGTIKAVIHAAGLSPHMGSGEKLMQVNAMGTINMNEVFYTYMNDGGCIIDVSSMSAYMLPGIVIPKRHYKHSLTDSDRFYKKMMSYINKFPKKLRSDMAYGISKNFVIWYAKNNAVKFGEKNIRIISVSPGSFETPMGDAEADRLDDFINASAMKRLGQVEEIAYLFKVCCDDRMGYLTGTDILCDGGCVASGISPMSKSK